MSRAWTWAFALLAFTSGASLFSCDDHKRLAKTSSSSAGGGDGGEMPTTTGNGGIGGTGGIEEPPGPTKLTLVQGLADADAARFCFLEYPDPSPGILPWPDVPGMAFAASAVIDLTSGLVPGGTDVEVVAIGGQVDLSDGYDCEQLRASPPAGVIVRSIGIVPVSVFAEEKSLLIVPNGCLGGPFKTDEQEAQICGFGYNMTTGNAGMSAGFMSRIGNLDRVPMQFVQASFGTAPVSLRLKPGASAATAQVVADNWSAGAIVPFPPFMGYSVAQLDDVGASSIELVGVMGNTVAHQATFDDALVASDLDLGDIANGVNIVFIALGATPGLAGSWWQPFTYTVVKADP